MRTRGLCVQRPMARWPTSVDRSRAPPQPRCLRRLAAATWSEQRLLRLRAVLAERVSATGHLFDRVRDPLDMRPLQAEEGVQQPQNARSDLLGDRTGPLNPVRVAF